MSWVLGIASNYFGGIIMKRLINTIAFSVLVGIWVFSGCAATAGSVTESPLQNLLTEAVVEGAMPQSVPIKGAVCTTEYNEKAKNRTTNVQLAAKALDGVVIQPGQVFSFNEAVGKTNRARGYKPAKIFVRGKEEQGVGGGVCQVSSTLYNAADFAGMDIIERHPHSKRVYYVPEGRDAATSYGVIDFKFRNVLDFPVKIVAKATDGKLTVTLEAMMRS